MVHKLCKCERIEKFTQLEGWYTIESKLEYAVPDNSTKTFESLHFYKLKYVDPAGYYALYKCLQFIPHTVVADITGAGATSSTTKLKGVVASYDRNTGKIKLEIVSMDDKNIWTCSGNGKNFRGTIVEFGVNTAAINDGALHGGFVGGVTLKKMEIVPAGYENFNFDAAYKARYDAHYPLGDN
jgi:hypothetical protein